MPFFYGLCHSDLMLCNGVHERVPRPSVRHKQTPDPGGQRADEAAREDEEDHEEEDADGCGARLRKR